MNEKEPETQKRLYIPEMMKIIEAAIEKDQIKLKAYTQILMDKLTEDGNERSANAIGNLFRPKEERDKEIKFGISPLEGQYSHKVGILSTIKNTDILIPYFAKLGAKLYPFFEELVIESKKQLWDDIVNLSKDFNKNRVGALCIPEGVVFKIQKEHFNVQLFKIETEMMK